MDCRAGRRRHYLGPDDLVHRRLPAPQGHRRVSRAQNSFNLPLEVFYLTIPLFMVLVFFYFTDRDQQAIDNRSEPADVVVDVRGKQWAWDFNYIKGRRHPRGCPRSRRPGAPHRRGVDKEKLPTLYLPVNKSVDARAQRPRRHPLLLGPRLPAEARHDPRKDQLHQCSPPPGRAPTTASAPNSAANTTPKCCSA